MGIVGIWILGIMGIWTMMNHMTWTIFFTNRGDLKLILLPSLTIYNRQKIPAIVKLYWRRSIIHSSISQTTTKGSGFYQHISARLDTPELKQKKLFALPGETSCPGSSEYVWQRGVEGILGQVTGCRSLPYFRKKKERIWAFAKNRSPKIFEIELSNLDIDYGKRWFKFASSILKILGDAFFWHRKYTSLFFGE